jgi:hypothetical protein
MVVFKFKFKLNLYIIKITLCYDREFPYTFALKYLKIKILKLSRTKVITRRGPLIGALSYLYYQAFEIALISIRSIQKL